MKKNLVDSNCKRNIISQITNITMHNTIFITDFLVPLILPLKTAEQQQQQRHTVKKR